MRAVPASWIAMPGIARSALTLMFLASAAFSTSCPMDAAAAHIAFRFDLGVFGVGGLQHLGGGGGGVFHHGLLIVAVHHLDAQRGDAPGVPHLRIDLAI